MPTIQETEGQAKESKKSPSDEVMIGGKRKLRRNYIVVKCSKYGQGGHNKTTCEKMGGRDVARSEAGNANGGGTQPVQPRQASSHNQPVQPRQALSQNQPVQTQPVQRRQTSTQTQLGKPRQALTQTQHS